MTSEELLRQRQALVHHIFSSEGDEFVGLVRKYCRGGGLAITPEIIEATHAQKNEIMGFTWWKFNPGGQAKGRTKKVLYMHGGGWVLTSGIVQYQFAQFLAQELGCEVWFPEYPLVPENNGKEAIDMVMELYKMMLKECDGDEIAIGGDSADGGLAVSVTAHIIKTGLPKPNTLVLASPGLFDCVQRRNKEEEEYMDVTSARDPVVALNAIPTALEYWRGPLDENDYRVNPSRAELKDFPTMLIFAGGYECMEKGIRNFVEKAVMEDVDVRYFVRNRKIHNYVLSDPAAKSERNMIVQRLLDPDNN